MSRSVRFLGIALALAAPFTLLSSLGCKEPAAPGTRVGSFDLAGTLEENACGQGLSPSLQVAFRVELRRSGNLAYWRMDGERASVTGTIDADGDFQFRIDSQVDGWAADPVNGLPACRFTQTETIAGRVTGSLDDTDAGAVDAAVSDAGTGQTTDAGDAGVVARTLNATHTITIGVVPGYDCSLSLVSSGVGGQFAALPCSARYALSGDTGQ